MCEEVREILEVGFDQLPELHGHRPGVADAGADFVLAHRLEQMVLALVREARHLLAAGEIGIVANAARVSAYQRPAAGEALGVGGVRRRVRGWQLRDVVGERTEIVVGEPLGGRGHRGVVPSPLPEQKQLSHDEELRLAAEGRGLRHSRLAAGAVASETHGDPFLDGRGEWATRG